MLNRMLNTTETASRRPRRLLLKSMLTPACCAAALFTFTSPVTAQDEPLKEIYAQIEHIKAGNEELRTLLVEQSALLDLAKEDPTAARNSLKPYSECINSVLKPYCPWFRASFKPEITGGN